MEIIFGTLYGLLIAFLLSRFVLYNIKKSEEETVSKGSKRTVVGFVVRYGVVAGSLLIASLFGRDFLLGSVTCVFYQVFLIFHKNK